MVMRILCMAGILLSVFSTQLATAQTAELPNILIVFVDDMGYGDSRVYNPESTVPMPNLDRLAENGMVFTDAHSTSGVCAPTRYSMLTGNYPWRGRNENGTWSYNAECQILDGQKTIGDLAQPAGYETAIFGKQHLGGHFYSKENPDSFFHGRTTDDLQQIDFSRRFRMGPLDWGFDYSYVLLGGIQSEPYVFFENDLPVCDANELIMWQKGKYGYSSIPGTGPGMPDYNSTAVGPMMTRKALDFIDRHHQANVQKGTSRPFLMHYCTQVLHTPCTPPETFNGQKVRGSTFSPATDMLVEVDITLGLFVDALQSRNLLDNTLIIFTADNGGWIHTQYLEQGHSTSGSLRGMKGQIWEGGHRVPFIARWGSTIKAGSRSNQLIGVQDVFATLADIAGQTPDENQGLDSQSFLPELLRQSTGSSRDHMMMQARYFDADYKQQVVKQDSKNKHLLKEAYALRNDDWKLIIDKDSLTPVGLFNLEHDLGEQYNLIDKPEQKDRVQNMMQQYYAIRKSRRSTP
jgi:arylsulfatase A